MRAKTRIIHLDGGQQRHEAENTKTHIAVFDVPSASESFRDLFIRNYNAIRQKCTAFGRAGVALIAIDVYTGKLMGSLCVAAKVGMANSATIGRHNMTDLYLDGDKSLSLRHAVVIVGPLEHEGAEVRFRLVDLRTSTAFQDEHGQRYEALVAEGPLFVRCGGYALFFLPTGDSLDWPEAARDGWACIPERVYLEEAEAEPDRWQRRRARRQLPTSIGDNDNEDDVRITRVTSVRGPIRDNTRLLAPGESPVGALRISTDAGVQRLLIGSTALRQGVLIGRYDRCDVDGSKLLTHDSISRVHLLVISAGESIYAIDTASTNGTWARGQSDHEIRIVSFGSGAELTLGNGRAQVRWCPVS